MKRKRESDNPLRAAALVGALGVDMGVCILLGYWAGSYAANAFGAQGWIVGGVLIGLFVGIVSCALMVKVVLKDG